MQVNANRFFIIIIFTATFSGLLFGYNTGVISGAILFLNTQFNLTPEQNGFVVGAALLGAFLGAGIGSYWADTLGRKAIMLIDVLVFLVGTVICVVATSVTLLIVGRVIVGVGIGIASYIAPLYIAEIAPTKNRGALVSLNQLMITVGMLIGYIINYIFAGSGSWRIMFGIGFIPAVLLLIGMIFLPNSPRWIMSHGHYEKALEILKQIRGSEVSAEQELAEIQTSLKQQKGSWSALFSKAVRPALLIGVSLAVLQQLIGVNTILYYAPTIFDFTGMASQHSAIFASVLIGSVFVVSTCLALLLIDRWGRRPLLFLGLVGMTISLAILSLVFHDYEHPVHIMHWLALCSMLIYVSAFAISMGPITWLMISEVYPLKVRGFASSLSTAANWAANMLVSGTFLILSHHLGVANVFLLYMSMCIVTAIFVYFCVPETKRVSLEAIEANLYAGKRGRHLGLRKF